MLKLSENPPIIYPNDVKIEEIEGQWRVAHTKSRNEKALAMALGKWEIPYFLPLTEKVTRRKQRVFKSLLPLFSGYVFFCGGQDQRHQAMTTNRIANIIEVTDQTKLITELSNIQAAMASGLPIDPHPHLKTGNRCRVIAGPLMGFEGIVIRKKNQTKILLEIDILGQAAAVEIDSELLERVEE
ncbi:MAG: hypothetical protein KAJ46_00535 [Sedimentisphaerales bacterium]|nr:hypothetical protein [Sedimentisphaerales bacterium]